jgi:class 3 adenylate cyclase/tetratricopeptide (TPR) repeat protein/tRNA A-37 threonylcarbamoyl transferase component Bud32
MELPSRFGNYELLERIALGGMAEVYLARSFGVEGFEKRLVIKRILPGLAKSRRFIEMFVLEAKISALLSHPNVVQVFDLGRVQDDHYIAMEHIHGRDLTRTVRKLRSQGERLPLPLAVHAAASIAHGLDYAHSRVGPDGQALGIVHRDVSPHNCMVSFEGVVKLLDFGIARLAGEVEPESGGRPGGGKFAYMSPEQAKGEPVDHRSDIFSCGIVLYELLVNHRLFQDPDPEVKLRKVREAIVPDPRKEVPEIPVRLWEILQKALARDREDRYPTAGMMEEDLRAFLFEHGLRGDDGVMGAFLRSLFAEDIKPDEAAVQVGDLVRGLAEEPEPPGDQVSFTASRASLGTPSVVAERKQVGVLVADLVGLTQASVRMEPEDVLTQHRRIRRVVERLVEKHGGWLDHLGDESLTVFFGVPRTQEDDLSRTLRCAQDLLTVRARLEKMGIGLEFAVGVHRGEVVWIDEEGEQRCVPRGDLVKLSRRLAAASESGEVLVSGEVEQALRDRWHLEESTGLRGRGSRGHVKTFVLRGRHREGAVAETGRWLPRGSELELVGDAVAKLAQGRGGIISIRGEGGTGKSRFVRELKGIAQTSGLPLYDGRVQPYGVDRPLSSVRDLLAGALGLVVQGHKKTVAERLWRLSELGLTETDIRAISTLFDLELLPGPAPTRSELVSALLGFVHGISRERPVILVLEDAHHLRGADLELMGNLLRARGSDQVLWLSTHRGPWADALPAPDQSVHLSGMDRSQQVRMLRELVGAERLGGQLEDLVVRTASGNPLYLVEMVKSLQQAGLIRYEEGCALLSASHADSDLPAGLEGLIGARLDALDPVVKQALQVAATIGPEFHMALLWEALGSEEHAEAVQSVLEQGMLVMRGPREFGLVAFSSQLLWDVVRRTTVGAQLRENHRRVAEGIERLHASHLEPHRESLMHHCEAAGMQVEAAQHAEKAGDLHWETGFLDRATECFELGIACLKNLRGGDEGVVSEGMAVLHSNAGLVAEEQGRYREAERHLQIALDLAEDLGLPTTEEKAMLGLGRVYLEQGRTVLARAHLETALTGARTANDTDRQVDILLSLGWLAREEADVDAAGNIYRDVEELPGKSVVQQARALMGKAQLFSRLGKWKEAGKALEQARDLAEESGDRLLIIRVLTNIGTIHYSGRRFKQSIEWFRQALEMSQSIGYRNGEVIARHNLADAHFRLGDDARAFTWFEQSRNDARELGMERMVALNGMYLGYLTGLRGEPEAGLELLAASREEADRLRDLETGLIGQWLKARLLCGMGDKKEGLEQLKVALEGAEAMNSGYLVGEITEEIANWIA